MSSPNPLWFLYDHNSATLKYKCVMFISASSSTLHLIVYYLLMRPVIQPAGTGIHTSVLHLIVHPCFCFHYKLNLGARQVLWCHTSIKNFFSNHRRSASSPPPSPQSTVLKIPLFVLCLTSLTIPKLSARLHL